MSDSGSASHNEGDNGLTTETRTPPLGILIGARPGAIVERHIGSTLGDVVPLSPHQTGILRRFLPNGFAEFLLGNSVVKLEPGYELRVNETIAVRRRPELKSKRIAEQDISAGAILILQQILGNLICKDEDNTKKLESLYSLNGAVITAGRVMAIYPEGMVLSANLSDSEDLSSWIFLSDDDLKDIRLLPAASSEAHIQSAMNNEYKQLEMLLSLDAGMQVTLRGDTHGAPKTIESLWWNKGSVLGRKAIFDGGRASVSILSLAPYQDTLLRHTTDAPPPDRSYLRLYTEFQNSDGLLFSICGYDAHGVIANFKPPSPASGQNSNTRGRCWVPFSFFDAPTTHSETSPVGSQPPALHEDSTPAASTSESATTGTLGKRLRESSDLVDTLQNETPAKQQQIQVPDYPVSTPVGGAASGESTYQQQS